MKLFLDTNILLDLLLERDGYEDSAYLFQLQEEGKLTLCVSILTMVNMAYVYKKTVGQDMAIVNIKYFSTLVDVVPMDGEQLQQAIMTDCPDFEDALQATAASNAGCDFLITRNVKDFTINKGLARHISIPTVMSPASFLESRQDLS